MQELKTVANNRALSRMLVVSWRKMNYPPRSFCLDMVQSAMVRQKTRFHYKIMARARRQEQPFNG
jgi:hypothetical protein